MAAPSIFENTMTATAAASIVAATALSLSFLPEKSPLTVVEALLLLE
jgi:hypothetical protein